MALLIDDPAVVRRDAGIVRVTGPDRASYLHTLLSQSLEDVAPGHCADFLYLDHKGTVLAAGRAVAHAEAILLVVPPEVAAELTAALEKFKFLTDVTAVDCTGDWALASVRGPAPLEVPGARPDPMTAVPRGDADGEASVVGSAGLVIRDRSGGVDLLGAPAWVERTMRDLGLPEASAADWEAWRILAGEPAWGHEIVPGRRAQELGLLPTHVHLRKGCYPGQESIAKTYNLGRPRRALAVVRFDGPVEDGERVVAGQASGELTSVVRTGEGALALALLPLDRETGGFAGGGVVSAAGAQGKVLNRVGSGLAQPGA